MSIFPISPRFRKTSIPRSTGSARGDDAPEPGAPPTGLPAGSSIHRRLIVAINGIFLVTMAVFLWISFSAESRRSSELTSQHLRETVGVLAAGPLAAEAEISEAERRLSSRTGVPHRVLLVGPRGDIRRSSDPSLAGRIYGSLFGLGAQTLRSSEWMAAEAPFDADGDLRVVLLRALTGREDFLRHFLTLHGIHVLVTMALFTILLQLAGNLYVKRPIARLAHIIGQLERGEPGIRAAPLHDDELGWLEERFARMAETLRVTVQRMVRAEKRASASAVVFRIIGELESPLRSLDRHTAYLEALAANDPELRRIEEEIREDRRVVLASLRRLVSIEAATGETEPGAQTRSTGEEGTP